MMERSALPALLLTVLLGLLMQGMLAALNLAGDGEWLVRALYLGALLLNLGAVRHFNPASFQGALLPLAPAVLALAATYGAVRDPLAPQHFTLLLLPIVHGAVCIFMLRLPPRDLDR